MEITVMLPYFEGTHDPDLDTIVVAGHLTDAEVARHLTELDVMQQMEETPRVDAEDGVASFVDDDGEIVTELEYHYRHATVGAPLRGE